MPDVAGDPVARFVAAVQKGDVAGARGLLAAHEELRRRINDSLPGFHFDGTALLAAVKNGSRAMVDLLLEHGADINQKSRWWAGGFGVLHGRTTLVDYLIERGAVVDAHAAAHHGMLERLRELVDRDPSLVLARGGDGQMPLHFAKTVAVAEYLLGKGADIDATDFDHESTAAQWMLSDRPEVARYLVSRGARTDVLMAAALGDLALVRRHLDADPGQVRAAVTPEYLSPKNPKAGGHIYNWSLERHATVHMIARKFGHPNVYALLMERSPGTLQLAMACREGDDVLAARLLAAEPGLAHRLAPSEQRLLVDAAQDGDTGALERMLTVGWDVAARGQEDGTALHWAAFHGTAAAVRLLLAHGAAADAVESTHGGTPLDWAKYGRVHSWFCARGDYDTTEKLLGA